MGINQHALEVHPKILRIDVKLRSDSLKAIDEFDKLGRQEVTNRQREFVVRSGGKAKKTEFKEDTYKISLDLFRRGHSIADIAKTRALTRSTIMNHLEKLVERGQIQKEHVSPLLSPVLLKSLVVIQNAYQELGAERLAPVYEKLKGKYSYDDLRLVRMLI